MPENLTFLGKILKIKEKYTGSIYFKNIKKY